MRKKKKIKNHQKFERQSRRLLEENKESLEALHTGIFPNRKQYSKNKLFLPTRTTFV